MGLPMPPPPPVVAHVQPPAARKPGFSLATAANHVPAHIIKVFKAQVTALAEEALPEPKDLSHFWASVERAVESLDETLKGFPAYFSSGHI